MAQPSQGVVGIAIERDRQQDDEGFTPDVDARHHPGELAQAGMAFALAAVQSLRHAAGITETLIYTEGWDPEDWWPWHAEDAATTGNGPPDFDGDDPVQLLRAAGALIAAEIDRHLAARQAAGGVGGDPLVRSHD